jgi:hypothetical protein
MVSGFPCALYYQPYILRILKTKNEMTKQRNNETTGLKNIKNKVRFVISLYRYIVISLVIVVSLGMQSVMAASVWDKESVISPPVGSEVLPGGGTSADNIKESVVFAKVIPYTISFAIRLAVALSVIVLIIGGYQYMTAYGSTEKHDTALKTIMYAFIGLVISLTAYAIVAIVTSIQLT